ncbi:Uncharacterised protein [Mycobacteroides abscessus subsp. abscessus]|nr:Uncharacterised protein [Mycobacteroides abscessus subsp. abscessus]
MLNLRKVATERLEICPDGDRNRIQFLALTPSLYFCFGLAELRVKFDLDVIELHRIEAAIRLSLEPTQSRDNADCGLTH